MKIKIFTLTILFGLSTFVAAQEPIYTSFFNNRAVGGYDTVSYFQSSGPVKGQKKFSTKYLGAEWLFANQENLETFREDPEKYAPAYGGYCAFAVSQGSTAKGDPKQWTVHNGKLYLNINAAINDQWRADKENFIELADQQWPALIE